MNVSTLLELPAEIMPDAECCNDGSSWSYSRLAQASAAVAEWLRGYGLGAGETVAFVQEASAAHIAMLFGAWRAGLKTAPLNFRLRSAELIVAVGVAQPRLIIADERYRADVDVAAASLPTAAVVVSTSELAARSEAGPSGAIPDAADVGENEVAVVMLTSGTTGTPKPIVMRHGELFSDAVRRMDPPMGISAGTNLLTVPTYHVAGMAQTLSSIYTGRTVRVMKEFGAGAWLDTVERDRIAFAFVVPTMLKRILASPRFDGADLSSLRLLSYGAAPASPQLVEEAVRRFPESCGLVNTYGQTETRGTITLLSPEDHRLARVAGPGREAAIGRLASVGRAVPGVRIEILPESGDAVLPAGVPGEVSVHRAELARPRRTGDLGYLDADGYLFLVGRASDRIIRGGENIDPVEIENVLDDFAGVEESAVVGEIDDEWGERVTAFVVPGAGVRLDLQQLAAHALARLASFKCPERYIVSEPLPRNSLGKVTRTVLRERLATP